MTYELHGVDRQLGKPLTIEMQGSNEADVVKRAGPYLIIERVTPKKPAATVTAVPSPAAAPVSVDPRTKAIAGGAILSAIYVMLLGWRSALMLFIASTGLVPGMRFQRRVRVLPGVNVNIGKTGLKSVSVGPRGATVTAGKNGVHTTVGAPGTGASVRI